MERDENLEVMAEDMAVKHRPDPWISRIVTRFIEVIILPVLALVAHFVYEAVESKAWSVTVIALFIIGVVSYVVVDEYRKLRHREREEERIRTQLLIEQKSRKLLQDSRELEEKKKLISLAREGELLSSTVQRVSQVSRGIALQYSKLNEPPPSLESIQPGWAYDQKWKILNNICDILKQDRRCYKSPADYFKATLFKVVSNDLLELDCNLYPPGDFPRTEKFPRNTYPYASSTIFRCLDERQMQIIPSIPEEITKGAEARWVELYPGQAKHYGSMLCTPITSGERAAHTYKVIAILTIDTNRINYFSEEQEEKTFLAMLLAPFRQQLSLIYLTTYSPPEIEPIEDVATTEPRVAEIPQPEK
jgi:hypothetical protein